MTSLVLQSLGFRAAKETVLREGFSEEKSSVVWEKMRGSAGMGRTRHSCPCDEERSFLGENTTRILATWSSPDGEEKESDQVTPSQVRLSADLGNHTASDMPQF